MITIYNLKAPQSPVIALDAVVAESKKMVLTLKRFSFYCQGTIRLIHVSVTSTPCLSKKSLTTKEFKMFIKSHFIYLVFIMDNQSLESHVDTHTL